jgi:hypothetical protein
MYYTKVSPTSATATRKTTFSTATTTADDKHVSGTRLIHNKGTATSERDVLVRDASVGVCAGGRVSKVRSTGPAKKHPCTTVVPVTFVIVIQATHLALYG